MKSVLMISQSNMAGRGFINEASIICNERIQMLRNGRWQINTYYVTAEDLTANPDGSY